MSVDAHRARGGRDEAGDDLHQCRLARAVGTEQSDDTFINRERDVVEGELFAVLLGDMIDFDGHLLWILAAKLGKKLKGEEIPFQGMEFVILFLAAASGAYEK